MSLDSPDWASIQYQNANNSVRVTDSFMEAADAAREWTLTARTDGTAVDTLAARDLLKQMAQAAWECADPGVQYDTTINKWHTLPNTGRINVEPVLGGTSIDDSACNLASLNLLKFRREDGEFERRVVRARRRHRLPRAGDPRRLPRRIRRRDRAEREGVCQLGLGYANLGALLMARGLAYDSDEGRAYAAAITALMTGRAYRKSAQIAGRMGSFAGYQPNAAAMLGVISMHRAAVGNIEDVRHGSRRSARRRARRGTTRWISARSPATGTRDGARADRDDQLHDGCDTTGVEPDFSLVEVEEARRRRGDRS